MANALIRSITSEFVIWSAGLIALYFLGDNSGPSLCLFHWMGFDMCLGCGLGHAIHHALHFDLSASMEYHPLGIPVLVILFLRLIQLAFNYLKPAPAWTTNN